MDLNMSGFEKGSPEERQMAQEVGERIRRAERKRGAASAIAMELYEETRASAGEDGVTVEQAMEFSNEIRKAHEAFGEDIHRLALDVFEKTTGTSIGEITDKVAKAILRLGISGFGVDEDGDVVMVNEDGEPTLMDDDVLLELAEPLCKLPPGIIPPPILEPLRARCEALLQEKGEAPATGDLGFLEGIDVDGEFKGVRDFDGEVE